MDTRSLIEQLSREAPPRRPLRSPAYLALYVLPAMAVYTVAMQMLMGIRPQLAMQFGRPMFALEVALLTLIAVTGAVAAVLAMYPDAHRKRWMLALPYALLGLLAAVLALELSAPQDLRMVIPPPWGHGIECALCITALSFVPSLLLFGLLRKGASVHPLRAGSFAVMAAWGMGCLVLRLREANDSLLHLIEWHYVPALLFAAAGALAGRYLLRW